MNVSTIGKNEWKQRTFLPCIFLLREKDSIPRKHHKSSLYLSLAENGNHRPHQLKAFYWGFKNARHYFIESRKEAWVEIGKGTIIQIIFTFLNLINSVFSSGILHFVTLSSLFLLPSF
jgi:hypothetical protein